MTAASSTLSPITQSPTTPSPTTSQRGAARTAGRTHAPLLRAELYKLRTHRTPWVALAIVCVGVLIAPAIMIFNPSSDPNWYTNYGEIWSLLTGLASIVIGGWILGTEYRQGTMKRMLTTEPRRMRALGAKGAALLTYMVGFLGFSAVVAWAGSTVMGNMNDISVPFETRPMLIGAIFTLGTAAASFALSAITRSAASAMVGTAAVLLILDPLLSIIPSVGKYSFATVLNAVSVYWAGTSADIAELGTDVTYRASLVAVALWLGGLLLTGVMRFRSHDI